jgi:hypothetical protein
VFDPGEPSDIGTTVTGRPETHDTMKRRRAVRLFLAAVRRQVGHLDVVIAAQPTITRASATPLSVTTPFEELSACFPVVTRSDPGIAPHCLPSDGRTVPGRSPGIIEK